MPPRRKYQRPVGKRRYRKLFVIAVEGIKTEPQYFSIFNDDKNIINIKCLKKKNFSSPPQVLQRMKKYLKNEGLRGDDEAWLVVDKDEWNDEQLMQLYNWSNNSDNYGFALSNPKFEYWLLLHFEEGTGIANTRNCVERLKRCLPNYDKDIDRSRFTMERILAAVDRAKQRDNPPCIDWPRSQGITTVYKLVENILDEK